ncbi:MAG: c-type cytochrome [Candidatus Binatia bacterium]
MRSMAKWWMGLAVGMSVLLPGALSADDHEGHAKLPPGPIADRHELMEGIGDQAQTINDGFLMGAEGFQVAVVQRAAEQIAASATRIPGLFPKGSTDPNSRALPAIWENWDKFVALSKQLEETATSLARAADSDQNEELRGKSKKMFATCKSCHDEFRKPEDKKP